MIAMRGENKQKNEKEILAHLKGELEYARRNIDAIIAIAERRGLEKDSPEYTQLAHFRGFFELIQKYTEKSPSLLELGLEVKPAYKKLKAGEPRWPVLLGQYAAAVTYEFHTALMAVLQAGQKLAELPQGGISLPQSKSLVQLAVDQSYSNTINAIAASAVQKSFALLKSDEPQANASTELISDDFTSINESKLTSKESEVLAQMKKLTAEIMERMFGKLRLELEEIQKNFLDYEEFQSQRHHNIFTELKERVPHFDPISVLEKMTTISEVLKDLKVSDGKAYLTDTSIPMNFFNEKGLKSTYRHLIVKEENAINNLKEKLRVYRSHYLMPLCYAFSNELLVNIRMGGVWPQSLDDKKRMVEKLENHNNTESDYEAQTKRFLAAISPHTDLSEAEIHLDLGRRRAEQTAKIILEKEIKQLIRKEKWIKTLADHRALMQKTQLQHGELAKELEALFKNKQTDQNLISKVFEMKSALSQVGRDQKQLSQQAKDIIKKYEEKDEAWDSMLKDPEFSAEYKVYEKTSQSLESLSNLEERADELNYLLLNNLDEVIKVNENAILSIKKALKDFHTSFGDYQAKKSQSASPSRGVSPHYQNRSRIAKKHELKSISLEAYLENSSDVLVKIEQEISQKNAELQRKLESLQARHSKLQEDKKTIESALAVALHEKRALLQSEAESGYVKAGLTYIASFVSDSFSKKQVHLDLEEKIHLLNANLADVNGQLNKNLGYIESQKEYQLEFEQDSERLLSMDRIIVDVSKDLMEDRRVQLEKLEIQFIKKFENLYAEINRPFVKGAVEDVYENTKQLCAQLEKENVFFHDKLKERQAELDGQLKCIRVKSEALSSAIDRELQRLDKMDIGSITPEMNYYKLGVMLSDESFNIRMALDELDKNIKGFEMFRPAFEENKRSILEQLKLNKAEILEASAKFQVNKKAILEGSNQSLENKQKDLINPASQSLPGKPENPKVSASSLLEDLRKIGTSDISLIEKKAQAKAVIRSMLPVITDLSELLKFKELVDTKHLGDKNPYAYIREERHAFRAQYGNTQTWNEILGEIQLKLHEHVSQNTFITESQYRDFYDIMKTRRAHTYGLGGMFHNLGGNAAGWKNPARDLDLASEQAADKQELNKYKR